MDPSSSCTRRRLLKTTLLLSSLASLLDTASAAADAPSGASVVAPAAAGQQALAVQASKQGLVARACAAVPCTPDGGKRIDVPADVLPLLARARAKAVALAGGRHVVRVDVPGAAQGASWVMLLAAPLANRGADPVIVWRGWTGAFAGEDGLGRMGAVIEEPTGQTTRIIVGERREDVTMCGRPTVVSARQIDPDTLTLARSVSVQNLSQAERGGATRIAAVRKSDAPAHAAAPPQGKPPGPLQGKGPTPGKPAAAPKGSAQGQTPPAQTAQAPVPENPPAPDPAQVKSRSRIALLRATVASSALDKKFFTLTDGDPETTWSENKKTGDGRGEFVTLSSASEVAIRGFELAVRPAEADIPGGVAPRTLFLATESRLFEVTMPEDAWQKPGARYDIKLPEPLRASCIAVVLDTAYAPETATNPVVTLAEITAKTELDDIADGELVAALAGGGDRAKAAAALLMRAGPAGVRAVIQGYAKLDVAGRQLAMNVVDSAPCSEQAPFFAGFLIAIAPKEPPKPPGEKRRPFSGEDEGDPEIAHARDRIRRCGRAAAPVLAKLIAEAADPVKVAAASELALIAPAEAVSALTEALSTAGDSTRRELRAALSTAAKSERASAALSEELALDRFRGRSQVVQIDLLRSITTRISRISGAAAAFHLLAVPDAPFRARYLLQAPAAALALSGDAQAQAYVQRSLLKDPDAHVRAHAAEVAAPLGAIGADLIAAADDPDPRVREAAIRSLGLAQSKRVANASLFPQAGAVLGRRLTSDPWTFVRLNSAQAIAVFPSTPVLDRNLASAVLDLHPDVRGHALDGLGTHRAVAHIETVRERASDPEEHIEVRARAILALARMCDRESLDHWTELAHRALAPIGELDRRLGSAAVAALGEVHPQDLPERLAPLFHKDAPAGLREMAGAALTAKPSCR